MVITFTSRVNFMNEYSMSEPNGIRINVKQKQT